MKVEKVIRLNVELDEIERMVLNKAIRILQRIEKLMEENKCNTFKSRDEYVYDIDDLENMIADLENTENISEIYD